MVLLLTGFVTAETSQDWGDWLKGWWGWLQTNSQEHAFFLLVAIAILPGLGVPSSPFLILCGALIEKTGSMPMACLLTASALWINALWTFLFAAYPGRRIVKKILDRFSKKLPELPQSQGIRLAVILRVTPGVPLTVQNYLLGVSGISLKNYLLVSLPVMALWAVGFVVFGDGLLKGNAKLIIVGVGLLIGLALVARMISKRYGVSK
ncbi:MAG: VTT domain-containing protein [Opitutales bacterium]|nr:VTT domain-containing protein [Opitutales bacterium]